MSVYKILGIDYLENMISNVKTINYAEKSDEIMSKAKDYISKVDFTRTRQELDLELKKVKIRLFTNYKDTIDMTAGFANPMDDEIFINKKIYKEWKILYSTVIHEIIHKLQKGRSSYKGKMIKGFIEGATDSITHKAMETNKCSSFIINYRLNVPKGAYQFAEAVFNSMDLALGDNSMKEFALNGSIEGLKKFKDLYGNKLYNDLRKFCNKSVGYLIRGKI